MDERALGAYRKGLALLPREHYLRRDLIDKLVGIYRRKDDLRSLSVHLPRSRVIEVLTAPSLDANDAQLLTGSAAGAQVKRAGQEVLVPKHSALLLEL